MSLLDIEEAAIVSSPLMNFGEEDLDLNNSTEVRVADFPDAPLKANQNNNTLQEKQQHNKIQQKVAQLKSRTGLFLLALFFYPSD